MSSTQRNTAKEREPNDYYVTPVTAIADFLKAFQADYPDFQPTKILDPCCGGNAFLAAIVHPVTKEVIQDEVKEHPASYPLALAKHSGWSNYQLGTIDIREDSYAERKGSFLTMDIPIKFDFVISNPPFRYAREFVDKSLEVTRQGGIVVMLLRLNFFGSQGRKEWFQNQMPVSSYLHSKRMSFSDDNKTDSIEYQHLVYVKGEHPSYTKLRII